MIDEIVSPVVACNVQTMVPIYRGGTHCSLVHRKEQAKGFESTPHATKHDTQYACSLMSFP